MTESLYKLKLLFDKLLSLNKIDVIPKQETLKNICILVSSFERLTFIDENCNAVLENGFQQLFNILCEENEKCREMSASILIAFCDHANVVNLCLPYISSILVRRLGKTDEREPSEEVRLLEVKLLLAVIQNYDGDLLKYLNDISNILRVCITDDYPEIKRKSCQCTSCLCQKQSSNIHMISTTLLTPLLETISHQHFRTRAICVKTIGAVVRNGSTEDFTDAVRHLAQRLFDRSPVVRLAVTEVIGYWLTNLNDRYSFFNRLIPLMVATLFDEIEDIKLKALNLWNEAGQQYLQENENDYKDLIDYPKPIPVNYPKTENRPSLGCRILVQRNIYSILPPLIHDISDWVPTTRMKSVQVLYSLIVHAEEKTTMHLSSCIEGIAIAAKDEQKDVVKMAISSAEMLGFFLDPDLLCDAVMTLIYKSPTAVHFSILAAVLRGNKKGLSSKCFQAICKLLADPSICRRRQVEEQANLLLCIVGLLSSNSKIEYITSHQIFTILSTVAGLTINNDIVEKAETLMQNLAEAQFLSLEKLFQIHCVSFLKTLLASNELWTPENHEMPIFYYLVHSDYADNEVLKLALPAMITNLNLKKDVKLRSKVFTLLIKILKNLPTSQDNEITEKVLDLIRLGIFPNLSWAPGKAASSLRIVAVASLYEIVRKDCINKYMLKQVAGDLLPIIATLSGDEETANRLLSCKILEFLLPKLLDCVDDLKIHATCHDFLQCMDDASDDVRIMTTRLLKSYIKAFPGDYAWKAYRSYVKEMYETVLIHMDDKNAKVKESVLSLLKDVAFVDPKLLLDEIEEKKYLMAAGDYCDNLIDHIKHLHV